MKFIGWIPPKQGVTRYLYLLWSGLVFHFAFLYGPLGMGLSLIVNLKNLSPGEFLSMLPLTFNISGASVKIIIVYTNLKRLHQTIAILDDLDERLQSDGDRWTIHKAVADYNYIFFIYGLFNLTYSVSVVVVGVVNGHPPWMFYNPIFDWRNDIGQLWIQTIFECIVFLLVATIVLITDTYTLVFVNNFRGHADVLKEHIRQLRTTRIWSITLFIIN